MSARLAPALALALLVAACGSSSEPGTVAAPEATVTMTASPAPATSTPAPPTQEATASPTAAVTPTEVATPSNAPVRIVQSCGLQLACVVDKTRGLPRDFVPPDLVTVDTRWNVPGFGAMSLRRESAAALVTLLSAAEREGHQLRLRSAYRSYEEQITTFQFWVDRLGEVQARRESAPPGHSEHQLGTTADVISRYTNWELIEAWGESAESQWLDANAHKYGFAISYPPDAEAVTGYIYEPWHIRYIGVDLATRWRASGQVLLHFLESLNRGN